MQSNQRRADKGGIMLKPGPAQFERRSHNPAVGLFSNRS